MSVDKHMLLHFETLSGDCARGLCAKTGLYFQKYELSDRPKVKAQSPVLLKSEAVSIRVKFKLETESSAAGEVVCSLITV